MRASDGHHKGSAERTLHLWPAQLLSIVGIAGIIEIIGGALVTVGPYTRAAAFIMSGESKTISEPCRLVVLPEHFDQPPACTREP